MERKKFLTISLVILFLLLGITIYIEKSRVPEMSEAVAAGLSMKASSYDAGGIDLDTTFTLKSRSNLDPELIDHRLTVEPAIPFKVKKSSTSKQEVLIIPEETLEPQKIYNFSLALNEKTPLKWAFQTKGDFHIVHTLPRDKSSGIPINTGIEISFSHLNFAKIQDYFSITPQVEGTFEIHKKTAVFVPKNLQPGTIYTVTIKKGLPLEDSTQKLEQDYVFQFETQEKQSSQTTDLYWELYPNKFEFATREKPIFSLGYFDLRNEALPQGEVAIYQYKDGSEYLKALIKKESIPAWASYSRSRYQENVTQLTSVANFSLPIQESQNVNYLEFPDTLPPGYYLAEISIKNTKKQAFFQITDLAVYSIVDNDQTLFWVHDLAQRTPIEGAEVSLFKNKEKSITNKSGLAQLTTDFKDTNKNNLYALVSKDNRETAVAITSDVNYEGDYWGEVPDYTNNYWKYFYLDRTLYKPQDTVHFWGFIKPRSTDIKSPKNLTVTLCKEINWRENINIESKEIPIIKSNFIGEFKLPNLSPGYYFLKVNLGDKTLSSHGFEVQTYTKPAYQLTLVPDRQALFAGDTMSFDVQANFYEGTPATNIPLKYHIAGQIGDITTDLQGKAHINYVPSYERSNYLLDYRNIYLHTNLPESGEISDWSSILVLNNDLEIESSGKIEKNRAQINVELQKLTVDKVNKGLAELGDKDAFKAGIVPNYPITVKVYEEKWEKREVGQYYDFINKKVMPQYTYDYQKIPLHEDKITTDKKGQGIYTFSTPAKGSYIVELSTKDLRGNLLHRSLTISNTDKERDNEYSYYHLDTGKDDNKYKVKEKVQVTMKRNEKTLPSRDQGFLFITAREGLTSWQVQDEAQFKTVFTEDLIPNFYIKGVCFDGRYYHETCENYLSFAEEEKALDLIIKTDKDEYRPQDTVVVEIESRDKQGQPVEAHVNLNLVDEALYAIKDQYTNILSSLYNDSLHSGIKRTFYTHQPPQPGNLAEGGGEGGSERKDFKDTVFFTTVTTDKKGKAKVQFKVPDNLTSWRLTCQGVTDKLAAGTTTKKIIVKLPFFVDAILSPTYLTGDQITVPIRSSGNKLGENTTVQYEVSLKKAGKEIIKKSLSASAFTMAQVPLPTLEKGNYKFTLLGKNNTGLTDTLSLDFQVVDSLSTKSQIDFFTLQEKIKLNSTSDSPITLVFSDYQRSQYLNILGKLQNVSGSRIEQKIAPIVAGQLLNKYFPGILEEKEITVPNLLDYQTRAGGIAPLPYSEAEVGLSAKIVSLYPTAFDQVSLANYFSQIANDPQESRERSLVALWGLASLDKPILQELKIISQYKNLTVLEKLYLILALTELGDEQLATQMLEKLIEEAGEDLETSLRINIGKDQDDILEATSLTAIAANRLDFPEKNKLLNYLWDNNGQDLIFYVEQLLALEKALPLLPEKQVSFNYLLDGKKEKITLKPQDTWTLILTPEKLSKISFNNIQGKIGVTALYNIPAQTAEELSIDGVKIKRSYDLPRKSGKNIALNDLVRIKISYEFGDKAPAGPYQISDFLPAGLKIVERPYYHGINDDKHQGYPLEIQEQKSVFLIPLKENGFFHYYARVINPGEFYAEPTLIQDIKSGKIYGTTAKDRMTIK